MRLIQGVDKIFLFTSLQTSRFGFYPYGRFYLTIQKQSPNRCLRPHTHILFHLELELELELLLESRLEFKLPRVIKAELLVVVEVNTTCCIRQCCLNSLMRSIIDRASLSLYSLQIRSTSRAPIKLEEIGLIA